MSIRKLKKMFPIRFGKVKPNWEQPYQEFCAGITFLHVISLDDLAQQVCRHLTLITVAEDQPCLELDEDAPSCIAKENTSTINEIGLYSYLCIGGSIRGITDDAVTLSIRFIPLLTSPVVRTIDFRVVDGNIIRF